MRVAVVGATGVVGATILEVMLERSFPADEVVPFASERSAGKTIPWGDRELTVQTLSDDSIQGFDLALFSAGSGTSEEWAPRNSWCAWPLVGLHGKENLPYGRKNARCNCV